MNGKWASPEMEVTIFDEEDMVTTSGEIYELEDFYDGTDF